MNLPRALWVAGVLGFGVLCSACEPTSPKTSSLRIHNAGTTPITSLTVAFPGIEVTFGDIPSGVTTHYIAVMGGVYGYSAFRFIHEGRVVAQPVIDWVGEVPMKGELFTYAVQLIANTPNDPVISLMSVTRER